MEKQRAVIHICNEQTMDGEHDKIEMSVVGTIHAGENGHVLEYTEYDDDGLKTFTTVTPLGNRSVQVTRTGAFGSEMQFEVGKRSSTVYSTPYGELVMGVYTKRIENTLGEQGGRLAFAYTTDFAQQGVLHNRMTLTVEVAEDDAESSDAGKE